MDPGNHSTNALEDDYSRVSGTIRFELNAEQIGSARGRRAAADPGIDRITRKNRGRFARPAVAQRHRLLLFRRGGVQNLH